jgi:predicted unusual protein kinase regulating ubiquinone biosynthesis (AarF/ABC1/UbiB family)
VGVTGLGLFGYSQVDEGFRRSLYFWTQAAPIYAHYRYVEFQHKGRPDAEYDVALGELHEKYADPALKILLDMRGFYIKLGQIGSTRDDFVPEAFLKRIRRLQDDVPHHPIAYVKQLVEKELERPFDEVFESIEAEPLGMLTPF